MAGTWTEVPVGPDRGCAGRRRDPGARRRLGDRHREGRLGGERACRSSRCRRPTPAPSGRPASACARPTGASSAAAGGAHLAGIVYEVGLTLDLPRAETVGTAMNALAHCAEALYVARPQREGRRACARGRRADRALAAAGGRGAERPRGEGRPPSRRRGGRRGARARRARTGACDRAGARRHARPAPRRDERTRSPARTSLQPRRSCRRRSLASARRSARPTTQPQRSRSWPASAGFERLRDFGVAEADLPSLAEAAAGRTANRLNPRPASAAEIEELLHSIY